MHVALLKFSGGYTETKKCRFLVVNGNQNISVGFSTAPRGTAFPQNFVEWPPENIHFTGGFFSLVLTARSFRCG